MLSVPLAVLGTLQAIEQTSVDRKGHLVDPDDARELSSFVLGKPVFFPPGGDVFNLLKEFQVRACSSALVGMVAPGGQS